MNAAADAAAAGVEHTAWTVQYDDCNLPFGNMVFTRALNGAAGGVQVRDGVMDFRCGGQTDFFSDPAEGKQPVATAPMLLAEVDNTKPFTFTAKVTPGFTPEGVYTAADLFVFAGDRLWQKLAFEQDERGNHRVVSVRTRGTYPSAMPVFFMPFLLRLLSRSAPAARGPWPGPPRRRGRRARLRGCASRS